MGCSASVTTDKSVVNSTIPANSPVHPHHSQDSIMNGEKGQQRVQEQDLVQNFLLVWLDSKLDESNEDFRNSIKQLQLTVDGIEKFRDVDECLKYISSFKNQKAFLIVSGALTENVVPRVHGMSQIHAVYIFCRKKSKYEQWETKEWPKVRGIFTEIDSICASVQQSARECDDDTVGITGELESSFMYTTFFKEIVLEIDFDEKKTIPELADYACQQKVEKALPPNHPDLAISYNDIALVYTNMGDYSKSLEFYEKLLKIREKVLPPNHPDLATSYNNIGAVYYDMGDYSKAVEFYEKEHQIYEKTLSPNHPDLAMSYNNIAGVYDDMGDYSKALEFYEKLLKIREKALPPNHPDLANSYNNIGMVYSHMGEYSKALSSYERSLEIRKIALPPNHPDLAVSYNKIGGVYCDMDEYSKALQYYEKAKEI
ncbi:unnamed protein product [Rotaria sordida]|uniref:Kinesin light chain n=1 Tax=Rotaria sordida TaxID=392033 RepID=A0A815RCH6_9BILA|nr:unnamed protein product [Rotaria sordida]